MPIFSGLDTPSSSDVSSIVFQKKRKTTRVAKKPFSHGVLLQIANAGTHRVETRLGLNLCARIVLEINMTAERAKSHRKECIYIAEQTFQLLNTVDGALKTRVIDVNKLLHDHVKRLKLDLEEILNIIKTFSSWWIVFRNWSAQRGLTRCHELLGYSMECFLLVLRTSLAKGRATRRRIAAAKEPRPSLNIQAPQSAWRRLSKIPSSAQRRAAAAAQAQHLSRKPNRAPVRIWYPPPHVRSSVAEATIPV